jgi:WhiB family redox-sensing transcriptional regulator
MEWMRDAACAGQPVDTFFPPEPEEGVVTSLKLRRAELREARNHALAFCNLCKVKKKCLDFALDNGEVGIWGGTTERQRQRESEASDRAARREVPNMDSHGTEADYQKHLRLNTVPCAECRRGHARYVADRRRARAAAAPSAG